jgi:hypothetical protein
MSFVEGRQSFSRTLCNVKPAKWRRYMSDLVSRVMKVAASELLYREAIQVDQEMEKLLAEMELVPRVEGCLGDFMLRFFALLKRRNEIARKALVIARKGAGLPPALRRRA